MSQYPPPYPPQQPMGYDYYQPVGDPLTPAKRAGVLMIILGVLAVLGGLCFAGMGAIITPEKLAGTPQGPQLMEMEAQLGMPLATYALRAGAIPFVAGIVIGTLGFFVRLGGIRFVVTSIALAGVMLLLAGAGVVVSVVLGAAQGGFVLLGGLCVYGIPFILLILLMVWLIQAARAAGKVALMRQQQQSQMWQHQQQQQSFYQGGYPPPGPPGYPPQQPTQPPYPPGQPDASQQARPTPPTRPDDDRPSPPS